MSEKYEGWSILELMGHRRLGGWVTEQEIAGVAFIRIDVPGGEGPISIPIATQFYSPSSVYCLTPTSEEVARAVAKLSNPAPVQRWEFPALPKRLVDELEDEDQEPDDDPTEDLPL